MTFRTTLSRFSLAAALATTTALAGCGNEANTQEAQTAEKATGINPENATSKTVTEKREVIVTEEKKVSDAKTGELLSDTTKTTPVTITKEKVEKTNVKVDVGDTKTSGTPNK